MKCKSCVQKQITAPISSTHNTPLTIKVVYTAACQSVHVFFQPLEVTRHIMLSDRMGFHFPECEIILTAYYLAKNSLIL